MAVPYIGQGKGLNEPGADRAPKGSTSTGGGGNLLTGSKANAWYKKQQKEKKKEEDALANQLLPPEEKPKPKVSLLKKLTHNPVTNIAGDIVKGVAKQAATAGNMLSATPVNLGPKPQDVVEKTAKHVEKKLGPDVANQVRAKGYKQILDKSGIGMNDSKATIGRKALGAIGGTAANVAPVGVTGSLVAKAAKGAAIAGTGGGLSAATEDKATLKSVLKGAAEGAAFGAALPIAGKAISKGAKEVSGKIKPKTEPTLEAPKPTRADSYEAHPSKPVTMEQAAQKLIRAGYSADEGKAILRESLPEKAPKTPGIGRSHDFNDASVKRAAHDFDRAQEPSAPTERPEAPVVDTPNPVPAPVQTEAPLLSKAVDSVIPPPKRVPGLAGSGERTSIPVETPKVSGGALNAEARAVEKNLTKEFEGKAEYDAGSYKQEAANAVDLVANDPIKAKRIAMALEPGDNTIHEVAVGRALEQKALREGDVNMLQQLASSARHTKTSEAAQRLGAEGYDLDPKSPVALIKSVSDSRAKAVEKRGKAVTEAQKADRQAIKAATPKVDKYSWTAFIDSIEC